TSDTAPEEKGRQLARLVKPRMSWAQVHALFGQSEAVFYDHSRLAFGRVVYAEYGVSVEYGRTGHLEARPLREGHVIHSPYFHSLRATGYVGERLWSIDVWNDQFRCW